MKYQSLDSIHITYNIVDRTIFIMFHLISAGVAHSLTANYIVVFYTWHVHCGVGCNACTNHIAYVERNALLSHDDRHITIIGNAVRMFN